MAHPSHGDRKRAELTEEFDREMPRFKRFAIWWVLSVSTAVKRLSRSVDLCASRRWRGALRDDSARRRREILIYKCAAVDESSLGAFLTAFFEEQAPMI